MDSVSYFHTLISEGSRHSILKPSALQNLQYELLKLLTDQFNRYTSGQSSSVPVETGQQIQQSVFYTVGYYLKSLPGAEAGLEALQSYSLSALYSKGKKLIETHFREAEELLNTLQQERIDTDIYAYNSTLTEGIPIFFTSYDIDYGAHDNPGSVDYPLCLHKMNLSGIDYILTYLRKLRLENEICSCFSPNEVRELLEGYDSGYKDLLFNLFELIFNNAIGCLLLGRSDGFLKISPQDSQYLQYELSQASPEQLNRLVDDAAARLIESLCAARPMLKGYGKGTGSSLEEDSDSMLEDYISGAAVILKGRLTNALETGSLHHLFLSFREKAETGAVLYEDSKGLDDKIFRMLSDEIRSCRYISDKLLLIKKEPLSLKDLVDLLECGCFYGNDFSAVFESLEPIQLALLVNHTPLNPDGSGLWDSNDEKEWHSCLASYLDQISHQKKKELLAMGERIKLASDRKL